MKRLFPILMSLLLLPALAAAQDVTVTLTWTDAGGQAVSAESVPVGENACWIQLTEDAPTDALTITYQSESEFDRVWDPEDGSTLENVYLAVSAEDEQGRQLNFYENGEWAGTVTLYISMQPAPADGDTVTVYVPVYCVTEDGVLLGETIAECMSGMINDVNAPPLENYVALAGQQTRVTVSADGSHDPEELRFVYGTTGEAAQRTPELQEDEPETVDDGQTDPETVVKADIHVSCVGTDGTTLGSFTFSMTEGENTVSVPELEGWEAQDTSAVTVTVAHDGTCSPEKITFTYSPVHVEKEIAVSCRLSDGTVLAESTVTVSNDAPNTVAAPELEGYRVTGEGTVTVMVSNAGQADPESAGFVYEPVPEAVITLRLVDEEGSEVAPAQTVELTAGSNETLQPCEAPEGYVLFWGEPVTVHVDGDGNANVTEVSFIYRAAAEEVPVATGDYVNRFGTVNSTQVAMRQAPSGKSSLAGDRLTSGTVVWVIRRELDVDGVEWSHVLLGNREGYIMSRFIDEMTLLDSDIYEYANGLNMPRYPLEESGGAAAE